MDESGGVFQGLPRPPLFSLLRSIDNVDSTHKHFPTLSNSNSIMFTSENAVPAQWQSGSSSYKNRNYNTSVSQGVLRERQVRSDVAFFLSRLARHHLLSCKACLTLVCLVSGLPGLGAGVSEEAQDV